jgi:hypothetical protein
MLSGVAVRLSEMAKSDGPVTEGADACCTVHPVVITAAAIAIALTQPPVDDRVARLG